MIQANTPISVTMTAERWNQVLAIMTEAPLPHRVTDSLIKDIHMQCLVAGKPEADGTNVTQLPTSSVGC